MTVLQSLLPTIAATLDTVTATAVQAAAERVASNARSRVPVNTGRLRDAIHTEADGNDVYVVAGGGEHNVFYGHLVEFGGAHTPPRPFLIPAMENERNQIVLSVANALRKIA